MTDFLTYLTNLFAFDDQHPLLFTQFHFWAFFFIVYIGFCLIVSLGEKRSRRRLTHLPTNLRISKARRLWRNGYLFFVSLFFYYKTSGNYVALLIFSTIVGYLLGIWFDNLAHRQATTGHSTQTKRKTLMIIGVIINLASSMLTSSPTSLTPSPPPTTPLPTPSSCLSASASSPSKTSATSSMSTKVKCAMPTTSSTSASTPPSSPN